MAKLTPFLMLVIAGLAVDALAVNGRLDVMGLRNEGLSAADAFTTSTLRIDASLEETVRLSRYLVMRANYRDLREDRESRSSLLVSNFGTHTQLPSLSLNYRRARIRSGLTLNAFYRDYDGLSYGLRKDERLDASAFLQATSERGKFTLHASKAANDRRNATGQWTESRNSVLRSSLQVDTQSGEYLYTGSFTRDDALTTGTQRDRWSHGLRYRGNRTLNENRGHASIEARTDLFMEKVISDLQVSTTRLTPFFIGYVLDDTPENLDPLEDAPISLPSLSDFDRDTATDLNIGDDMTPVREFGGDYRNLVVDFGDIQIVGSANLYVDRIVNFNEFLLWRLYTSDDPEGIDWTEVPTGTMSAQWREWGDARQGWEFNLSTPVSARRFKLVGVKVGPTEPDIFLNELEFFDPQPSDQRIAESTTRRHYLQGTLSYDLTQRLTVGYRANLTKRQYDDEARDLTGQIHTFDSRLKLGTWNLLALYSRNTLNSPSRQNTDSRSTNVSLSSPLSHPLMGRLAWHHDKDLSLQRQRVTDNISVDASWRAAPGLVLLQKVGYGTRNDENSGIEANSWFSTSTIHSQPRRSLSLDLQQSSRWVSRDVGEGYSKLEDTDVIMRWAIFPLLSYTGNYRHESRIDDEWLLRNILSWNPLTTGTLDMRFSVNHYRETRTDTTQKGAGVHLTLQARPRLRLEGRLDVQQQTRYGVRNTPFNTQWRATWTF